MRPRPRRSSALRLGRGVRIVTGRKKGRIELEYYGMDDLNDLLEALALLRSKSRNHRPKGRETHEIRKTQRRGAEPLSPQEDKPSGKKPVVIYIMILFIVAFLLMALSFVMHQRSNTEVLGELQDSVSAMQEIQTTQDALLDLQDQLDDAEETVEALEQPERRPRPL